MQISENQSLQERFNKLATEWKQETSHISTLGKRYKHKAYGEILSMGESAVPLILNELRRDTDWWFDALEKLTNRNPARNAQTFYEGVDEWISWGIAQELIK